VILVCQLVSGFHQKSAEIAEPHAAAVSLTVLDRYAYNVMSYISLSFLLDSIRERHGIGSAEAC